MFRSSFFAFCHIYNYKGHKRRLKAGDKEIMNQDITGILNILSANIRNLCTRLDIKKSRLIEVRLRVNEPLILMYDNMEYMVTTDGRMKKSSEVCKSGLYIVTIKDINETVEHISKYSLYAYEDEVRQGFITIEGGHRVGIAGKVILENGRIKNLKHITFLNIRIAHEVKGCGSNIIPYKGQSGVPYADHFPAEMRQDNSAQGYCKAVVRWKRDHPGTVGGSCG